MRFRIGFIFSSLLLTACTSLATIHMHEELRTGQIQFDNGNFKSAFHHLLPVAAEGNREAQYAVGYMYYYGYGVAEDYESAEFWLQRAAKQHDVLAIQALHLLHKEPAPPMPAIPQKEIKPTTQVQDSMLQSEKKPDAVLPIPTETVNEADASSGRYTLQLFGSGELSDLTFLQKRLSSDNACHIAADERHGKPWYVLTYGRYTVADDARLAREHLPDAMLAFDPWVRNTDDLRFLTHINT